jgi:hypothetical protein
MAIPSEKIVNLEGVYLKVEGFLPANNTPVALTAVVETGSDEDGVAREKINEIIAALKSIGVVV